MSKPSLGRKGQELVLLYQQMAREGYERADQKHVDVAFSDFELRPYRAQIKPLLDQFGISSVLDYGCGGSNWQAAGFDDATGLCARDYFGLQKACCYEPARGIDERQRVDCVISFDVLEHVFVADIPQVLRDMFSCAGKLLIINVACYPAAARLPNGENAHITVRTPAWWKGMLDAISVEFPDVAIFLICSTAWRKSTAFPVWSASRWEAGSTYVTDN